MSLLHSIAKITSKPKKRVGRGIGSGLGGHTAGRGTKGQKSRTGSKIPLWFEGGQLQFVKRLPMWRGKGLQQVLVPVAEVTLQDLNNMKADQVSLETLKIEKVIHRNFKKAKIVSKGTLTRKVTLDGIKATKTAQTAIEKAGGTVR